MTGFTALKCSEAGVELGGQAGITMVLDDLLLVDNTTGIDAWDRIDLTLGSCHLQGNDQADDRFLSGITADCSQGSAGLGDLSLPAGPDLLFFTKDDPWLSDVGGAEL